MTAKSLLSKLLSMSLTAQARTNADTCAARVCASWARRSVLFTGSVKSLLSLDSYNEDVDADDDLAYWDKGAWPTIRGSTDGDSLDMDSYTASMTSPSPRPVSPQVAMCASRQGSSRAEAQDGKETRWRHEVVTPNCSSLPADEYARGCHPADSASAAAASTPPLLLKVRAHAGGGSGKAAYDVVNGLNGAVQRISVDDRAHSQRQVSETALPLPHPRLAETVAVVDHIGRARVGGGNAEATCSSGHPVLGFEGLGRYFHHQRPSWGLSAVVSPRHQSLSLGRCLLSWLLITAVLLLCPHAP